MTDSRQGKGVHFDDCHVGWLGPRLKSTREINIAGLRQCFVQSLEIWVRAWSFGAKADSSLNSSTFQLYGNASKIDN